MTNSLKCTAVEKCNALKDTYDVAHQYGDNITVYVRNEGDISRDTYEDMKSGKLSPDVTPIFMPANPITFQPNRRVLEKAGMREDCDVLLYTPMYSWIQAGIDFEEIDLIRSTVILRGIKYVIKEKGFESQFIDTYLYVVLALRRK
jgi:hypothetical protein